MAAAAKPKGKGLGRKVGPFSVWVYLVVGLAIVGAIIYARRRSSSSAAGQEIADAAGGGAPSIQPVPGGYSSGGGGGGFPLAGSQGPAASTAAGTTTTGGASSDYDAALLAIGTDFENAINFFNERGGVTGLDQAYQSGQWHSAYPTLTDSQAKALYDALRTRLTGAPGSASSSSIPNAANTTAPDGYAFPQTVGDTTLAPTPSTEQAAFQLTGDPTVSTNTVASYFPSDLRLGGADLSPAGDFGYDPTPKVAGGLPARGVPPWKTLVPPPGYKV